MHRCLTIVEVQHAIFHKVQAEPWGGITLARIARTCRTFNNSAVDILWENLPSLKFLIQSLPTDLWKISTVTTRYPYGSEIKFQRAMSASDWEIFFRYSSRVRSLTSSLNFSYGCNRTPMSLDIDVIIALSQPPSFGPLIPNLKTLCWTESDSDSDEKYAPLLQSILSHTLFDLSLPSFFLRSPQISMDVVTKCPSLKNLCIENHEFPIDSESQGISPEILERLCSLESFEYPALDEATILSLSKFPSLVKLSGQLRNNLQLTTVRPSLTPPTFPSLHSLTLSLRGNQLSTLTSLFQVVCLRPQEVAFTLDTSPTSDILRLFFSAMVNGCDSNRLSKISLTLDPDDALDGARPQISLSTFESLLAFPNMESFTFDLECNVYLDDAAMDALTERWPKLAKLSINASFGWGIKSRVTHWGLLTLLSRCPFLTDFALAVDFVGVDIPPESIPQSRLGNKITSCCRSANLVTSKIDHPASIAAFLSDVCPRLESVMSFWDTENESLVERSRDADRYGHRWERVNEFLPAFLAVRRQS